MHAWLRLRACVMAGITEPGRAATRGEVTHPLTSLQRTVHVSWHQLPLPAAC